jgi:hypothetical protein
MMIDVTGLGARSKLTELATEMSREDFEKHGADVIRRVRGRRGGNSSCPARSATGSYGASDNFYCTQVAVSGCTSYTRCLNMGAIPSWKLIMEKFSMFDVSGGCTGSFTIGGSITAPQLDLTMAMPKATQGLASVFGTELTDGRVRPETSRASGIHLFKPRDRGFSFGPLPHAD